jgi:hypothetical protein
MEARIGYEPTAWMRQKVRERLVQARPVLRAESPRGWAVVILMLTEPDEDASDEERERWELSCDRCGTYCPPPSDFFTGQVTVVERGHRVAITFGMCRACKQLENVSTA